MKFLSILVLALVCLLLCSSTSFAACGDGAFAGFFARLAENRSERKANRQPVTTTTVRVSTTNRATSGCSGVTQRSTATAAKPTATVVIAPTVVSRPVTKTRSPLLATFSMGICKSGNCSK